MTNPLEGKKAKFNKDSLHIELRPMKSERNHDSSKSKALERAKEGERPGRSIKLPNGKVRIEKNPKFDEKKYHPPHIKQYADIHSKEYENKRKKYPRIDLRKEHDEGMSGQY